MNVTTTKTRNISRRIATTSAAVGALLLVGVAQAAVEGIVGTTFNLTASAEFTSQPDGANIYSWGYGCTTSPASSAFRPTKTGAAPAAKCPLMQIPGPTLIVTQGTTVTVTLTNKLPNGAGRTSIVFPPGSRLGRHAQAVSRRNVPSSNAPMPDRGASSVTIYPSSPMNPAKVSCAERRVKAIGQKDRAGSRARPARKEPQNHQLGDSAQLVD